MEKQVYICNCKSGDKISKEKVAKWKEAISRSGNNFILIEDLCGTAVKNPEILKELKNNESSIVFGCNPRAMEHVLFKSGIRVDRLKVELKNMETECTCKIEEFNINSKRSGVIEYNDEWKSWYPVIDYSRCSSCMKCLNFCLFSVYKSNEYGVVLVDQPANCKDLCPACARTCPEQAIIFPKHNESPIDGGEGQMEVLSSQDIMEQFQNNTDIYKILRDRRKNSGVMLLKDQEEVANMERTCCVNNESEKKKDK